jgi:hypothetical protein
VLWKRVDNQRVSRDQNEPSPIRLVWLHTANTVVLTVKLQGPTVTTRSGCESVV